MVPCMSHFLNELSKFGVPFGVVVAAGITVAGAWWAARIAYSNKIADFRQAWINELRTDISEYWAAAEAWSRKRVELNLLAPSEQPAKELTELAPLDADARKILNRVLLRINPETDPTKNPDTLQDRRFLEALTFLLHPSSVNHTPPGQSWQTRSEKAIQEGRLILKREWEATKRVIPFRKGVARPR